MLSDEQVIEMVRGRLTNDLSDLAPAPDLLDRVRDQTRSRSRRGPRLDGLSRRRGPIALVLSCVLVLAVAAGALALLHSSPRTSGSSVSSSSGLRGLVGKLSVFGKPQTSAARTYNGQIARRPFATGLLPQLTRAVPISGGATVYLYVLRSGAGYAIGAAERTATNGVGSCCLTARAIGHPRGPAIESGYQPGHHDTIYYEVVPNGVARVRWFFPMEPQFVGGGPVPQFSSALTVIAPVRDNIAAIEIPQRGAPTHEYWLATDGRVLASTVFRPDQQKRTHGSVTAAINAQDRAIQHSLAAQHLLALHITSARAAGQLASRLRGITPAQARRLIPELEAFSTTLGEAALAVSSKTPSTATQKQAQRDWVAGAQGLARPAPFLAGLSDILGHRKTATIALRRQQTRVVESDRLLAHANKILHIRTPN